MYGAQLVLLSALMTFISLVWHSHMVASYLTYLIAREEKQCVGVSRKRIDRGEHALQVYIVIRSSRILAIQRIVWRVDVERQVDARRIQQLHACIVVLRVVDGVHAHGVDAQLLELGDISSTRSYIGQWV